MLIISKCSTKEINLLSTHKSWGIGNCMHTGFRVFFCFEEVDRFVQSRSLSLFFISPFVASSFSQIIENRFSSLIVRLILFFAGR